MKCPELKYQTNNKGDEHAIQCADCSLSSYGRNCLGQPIVGKCRHCGKELGNILVWDNGDIIEQDECFLNWCNENQD